MLDPNDPRLRALPPANAPVFTPPRPAPSDPNMQLVSPPPPLPPSVTGAPDPGAFFAFLADKIIGGLQLPQQAVQTVLGGGSQQRFRDTREDIAQQIEHGTPNGPIMKAIINALPGIGQLSQTADLIQGGGAPGAAAAGLLRQPAATAFRVGTELGTDPLSYVGGIGALSKLGQAAGWSPKVLKTLQVLARGEDVVQKGLNLPVAVTGKAVKGALSIPGSSFGREVIEQTASGGAQIRKTESLYDFLSSKSKESFMKGRARQLIDAYHHLRGEGYDLEDIIGLEKTAATLKKDFQYKGTEEAAQTLQQMERAVIDLIDTVDDPRAKIAALDAIASGEKMIGDMWEQRMLPVQELIDKGAPAADIGQAAQLADQTGFDDAARILMSVQDTINSLNRFSRKNGPVGAQASGQVDAGIKSGRDYLLHQIDAFHQKFGAGPVQSSATGASHGPFVYAQGLRERGGRFSRDIGGLTTRLRGELEALGEAPLASTDDVTRRITQRSDELAAQGPNLPGFTVSLPPELRSVMTTEYDNLSKKLRELTSRRQVVVRAVQKAWDRKMPGQAMPALDPEDMLGSVSSVLQQAGVINAPLKNTHDVIKSLSLVGTLDSNQILGVRNSIAAFPAGDILKTDPFELVIDRVIREQAKTLGLGDQSRVSRIISDLTSWYKEQALLSSSYPATNLTGGLFMGALKGVNPLRVMRGFEGNLAKMAKGEAVQTRSAANFASTYGEGFGEGTRQASGLLETTPVREYLGRGVTASQRLGATRSAAGGAALGGVSGFATSPSDASPQEKFKNAAIGAATGATGGAIMPWVSKKVLHDLGGGIETVMRETAATQGAVQYMAKQGDRLVKIVDSALGMYHPQGWMTGNAGAAAATPLKGLRASAKGRVVQPVQRPYNPGNVQALRDEIATRADSASAISPDELFDLMTHAGIPEESARAAQTQWRDVVHEGVKAGQEFSNSIHFDYHNLNNMEQFLKTFVPFSTWAAKAIPFFAEEMAQHPIILASLIDINKQSQYEQEKRGMTNRVAGALPFDYASGLLSALLGHQVDSAWFDPTKGLLPFSGVARQFGSGSEDDPVIKQILSKASGFGPGPHPLIEMGLRATGMLGNDEPSRGYLRWGAPIAGVESLAGVNSGRGIDLNAPIMSAENALRRGLGGQDPVDTKTSLAMRRLDELALKDTGKTIRSNDPAVAPYIMARTRQSGPLWDRAMAEVSKERGLQSATGFAFGMASPQAIVTKEEGDIRGAQTGKIVPDQLSNTIRQIASDSPNALMPPQVIDQVRQLSQQMADRNPALAGKIPDQVEMVLSSAPTAKNLQSILGMITEAQAQLENPAIQGYSTGGSPNAQKLSALLSEYNNVGAQTAGMDPNTAGTITDLAEMYKHPALKATGVNGALMRQLRARQDAFRAANPILDQYLNYLGTKPPNPSTEDFLANHYGK